MKPAKLSAVLERIRETMRRLKETTFSQQHNKDAGASDDWNVSGGTRIPPGSTGPDNSPDHDESPDSRDSGDLTTNTQREENTLSRIGNGLGRAVERLRQDLLESTFLTRLSTREVRTRALLILLSLAAVLIISVVVLAERDGVTAHLRINEIMASNGSTIADEDGDYSDWIELHYGGSKPVDLTGFYLSDDQRHLTMWKLPEVTIHPGETLLIWASGKDRRDTEEGELHTNFRINAGGEPVVLTAPDGIQIIDLAPPMAMSRDQSWGRKTDGGEPWVLFQGPTPNGPNEEGELYPWILEPPVFSQEGGFYTEAFDLTLELAADHPDALIYYTLDGSDPDPENLSGTTFRIMQHYPEGELLPLETRTQTYEAPIAIGPLPGCATLSKNNSREGLPALFQQSSICQLADINPRFDPVPRTIPTDIFRGQVVRAMAATPEGYRSPVVTHSYFVDPAGWNRHSLPVVSIVTDPAHLFDFHNGIYVAGSAYTSWQKQHPEAFPTGDSPANYTQRGIDWERPVHLTFHEADGTPGFDLNLGLRLHGGWGRSYPLKSLRLYPRYDYDDQNRIRYPLFPGLTVRSDARQPLEEFNRIILRNAGNDLYRTLMRDPLMQRLVEHLSFDTQAYRPVVHYLNGEYWGIINLRERFDADYVVSHYGVTEEEVVMLSENAVVDEGTAGDRVHFLALRNFIRNEDMSDPENFAHVQTLMDTDNFLEYNLSQIYFRNTDWPIHNVRIWRKRTEAYQPDAPLGHDGRWRWMLYDTDHGFGFAGGLEAYTHNTLTHATGAEGQTDWTNPEWSTVMLQKLLENETFRNQFINTFADQLNTAFHPDRVKAEIAAMEGVLKPELAEHRLRWGYGGVGYDVLRTFAEKRPEYVRQHLMDYFGLVWMEEIAIKLDPEKGIVRVNSLDLTPGTPGFLEGLEPGTFIWSGTYFPEIPIHLDAVPAEGYRFTGWGSLPRTGGNGTMLQPLFVPE